MSGTSTERRRAEGRPGGAPALRVVPVDGRRLRTLFLGLPHALYAGDPAWIPPLLAERRRHLSPRNPFFENGVGALWLALRGDRPVGRISAQVDRLHEERHGEGTGFFGWLEAEDDEEAFRALFDVAEAWLVERGMSRACGPFSFSINQECGLLVSGFEAPPQVMMPHGRPYYPAQVEAAGYAKDQDLLAYRILDSDEWPRIGVDGADRMRIRPLAKAHMKRELGIVRDLFNDAWSENWGFVPFTDRELAELGSLLKHVVPADFVRIAEEAGEPVAFLAALPNVNEAIADLGGRLLPFGWAKLAWRLKLRTPRTARIALLGLRRDKQRSVAGARIVFALIDTVRTSLRAHGVQEAELSWILEGNRPMRSIVESLGGEPYKRYRIYSKDLA